MAGTEGCTISTMGTLAMAATGATSRTKSKFNFERATSEKAWYSAKDQIVRVAPPVRLLAKGRESLMGAQTIEIDLKKK